MADEGVAIMTNGCSVLADWSGGDGFSAVASTDGPPTASTRLSLFLCHAILLHKYLAKVSGPGGLSNVHLLCACAANGRQYISIDLAFILGSRLCYCGSDFLVPSAVGELFTFYLGLWS